MADTGYNIATYRFMFEWDGYWTLAMLLANLFGYVITCLPGGASLLGLNIYTSLFLGMSAVGTYQAMIKKLPKIAVFVGELIALGLCWCPSSILYNYLTYMLLLVALWLLFKGLTEHRKGWLLAAGVILGINVFVRFSNLTQMAFILSVWFYCLVSEKWNTEKNWFQSILYPTLWCMGGYVLGAGLVIAGVAVSFGLPQYFVTLSRLSSMSSSAEGYSASAMLLDAWRDYASILPWIFIMIGCTFAGMVLFHIFGATTWRKAKTVLFLLGFPVLLRLMWGRRIIDTDYYSTGSVWYIGNMFIVLAYVLNAWCLCREKEDRELQLLSAFAVITLLIAPLGTNNHAYATLNNLFLVAPVTLYLMYLYLWKTKRFPIQAMAVFFLLCLTWQTVAFHTYYVFGDSSRYEKRDTKIENNGIIKGLVTSRRKAINMESLGDYVAEHNLQKRTLYVYGNIPALCYYLDQKPATPALWADLESYEKEQFKTDLNSLAGSTKENRPIFILHIAYAAIADEGITYLGETPILRDDATYKLRTIYQFLKEEGYTRSFQNELFVVYE